MLALSRKADYALVGLMELARLAPEQVSARALAEHCLVPLPMLMNILKELVSGGLVCSMRGATGGYRLARDPQEITLEQLIHAVEGPVNLTLCCGEADADQHQHCDLEGSCLTEVPIQKVNEVFRQFLGGVTLAHLMTEQVPIRVSLSGRAAETRQPAAVP